MLVLYLMRERQPLTDYEIATGVRDQRSNTVRNLYALVSEGIILASRDKVTGIVRYEINRRTMSALSDLLRP
jgi:predicted transcriptional regulator